MMMPMMMMMMIALTVKLPEFAPAVGIVACSLAGVLASWYFYRETASVDIGPTNKRKNSDVAFTVNDDGDANNDDEKDRLFANDDVDASKFEKIRSIHRFIERGANTFLMREYFHLATFMIFFGALILVLLGTMHDWASGTYAVVAFFAGALTSTIAGYIGMKVAVFANARTTVMATHGVGPAFRTAYVAAAVMGFSLVSMAAFAIFVISYAFRLHYKTTLTDPKVARTMFQSVAGFGVGASSVALFARVGGGIFTKAADVGADLSGKVDNSIPEDDPRNPAVIADNVGDNVGDIAGMGADLFGSFAGSNCAALVIASQSPDLHRSWNAMMTPLVLSGVGILVCLIATIFVIRGAVRSVDDIQPALKNQITIATVLMTPASIGVCMLFLPSKFNVSSIQSSNWKVALCVVAGLWSGLIIGHVTEYFTSYAHAPVREVAEASRTGAAPNIIFGLSLGYKSVVVPVVALSICIYVSYALAGTYGIAMSALGMLSTLSTELSVDAYGPICDNAGGIAEMAGLGEGVRHITDELDAAGNTTAAIGKGFAIGSAALVGLALFGAFVNSVKLGAVDLLHPFTFGGLLVGAMLPYWFSAMTVRSVGTAANEMVEEVRRQFKNPNILSGVEQPDYERCVAISTDASLKEMIAPGALVMLSPLIVGFLFGVEALSGLLAGSLTSGVQMAISASNTGGAWDNAKKYVEQGHYGANNSKGSEMHKAAVIGDTVGDPLKDTSGPALNILIKLMAIISVVFAPAFASPRTGGLAMQLWDSAAGNTNANNAPVGGASF
eukprot:TRINITY_DN66469_c9_g8_i1.p1 TRINITY_DN66469_c9_g8~~TRINITY_DN66469_c9_g8_i1.p1  ORF type:complete len:784 (+),score=416.83 TRINITY_DN66469_c9_g8_i1:30-2381(+)